VAITKIKNKKNHKKRVLKFDYIHGTGLPYSQFYEHVSTPIVVISTDFTIEYFNKAAEKFYSRLSKKSIGKKCYDEFSCALHRTRETCPVTDVLDRGTSQDMRTTSHLGVDNCYVHAFPLTDKNGKIHSVVIEDFTRLTSATTHAEDLESRFSKMVELAVDAIFILGKNFVIEFANTYAVFMIGEPIEDIVDADFRKFFHDKKVIEFLEKTYHGEDKCESICYYSEKSVFFGKKKMTTVEMCITRSQETDNQVEIYVYLRDITEEKKLQNHLKQTNEFLSNLINHSADGIMAADTKGNIIIFNESAEKLLGYSAREAMNGLHITQIYRPGFAKEIMRMLRSEDYGGIGKMKSIEAIAISNTGEEIPCNMSAAIIYDKDGNEVATVGIFSDLRESKRMQRELEETQLKLLQSEKMSSLGKLAAGIAHEINNPLGGIMIFANLLIEELDKSDPTCDDVKKIIFEAARCKNIVKGLLDFSRQTDSKMSVNDLNKIIAQTMMILENQAIFHNIKVIKDYDTVLPLVKCDRIRISQVFLNIILNAADAMGQKGEFIIRTRYNKDKETAAIEFTDTGCGIPDEIQNKIFDPFFTTKEVGKGTGLGLSMSYGIIKDHNGTINVKSKIGEGTTFIIELPVVKE
jgi:PAS domain S-box-containing protein